MSVSSRTASVTTPPLGEVFPIQETATGLTIDIIGEVVMGINFDSQHKPTELTTRFQKAVLGTASSMDAIDLFLQAYLDEKFGATNTASSELVPDFMSLAVDNVKSLLLGGHDTTASAIAYIIALLSEPENKDAFERVRMKHDSVFGPNPQEAAEKLMTDHPKLRNTLPLTTAAIKEAMRLFPPALSSRTTTPGHPLRFVTFNGRTLPIAGQQILISHYDMGQREDLWPEPPKFNLDRYSPGVPQVKHAWRSFEKGPRGCAGLELAKMEMRIVHVLLARELDVELAFPDDAPRAPSGHGVAGGRGYQIIEFAAKPVGHMPMPVRRREKANI